MQNINVYTIPEKKNYLIDVQGYTNEDLDGFNNIELDNLIEDHKEEFIDFI